MADVSFPLLKKLREQRPRVHCISGAITAAFIADVAGALCARPAVTHDPAEAGALAASSDAVLINLSQPDPLRISGAHAAAEAAHAAARPWVLDPVLANASQRRKTLVRELLAFVPTVLKPNRAELVALSEEMEQADMSARAKALAEMTGAVVLASGEHDIISDGADVEVISGGHAFMDMMSGYGCALGAAVAALLAVGDPWLAAKEAARAFAVAGSRAAERSKGPASFRVAFVDELFRLGEAA
jgi:hydroxyethylthiazole kinase